MLLGPLHMKANSRDHEIVRAPKGSVQRPSQTHLQNHVEWSRILKCSVKSCVTGPSLNATSMRVSLNLHNYGTMFHGHLDYFKNHKLEVGLTQNRGTMTLQMLTTVDLFYCIMCEDPH